MINQLQTPTNLTPSPLTSTQHELPTTRVEISASAFNANVALYKKLIGNGHLAPVIKSNAYGHGIMEIGQLCEQNSNVSWLCLTSISEALKLRAAGITKPILLLFIETFDQELLEAAALHNIDFMVYDTIVLHMLNTIGKKIGKQIFVHLKVETGLSRFGVTHKEFSTCLETLKQCPALVLRALATHCAETAAQNKEFTLKQLAAFNEFIALLTAKNIFPPLYHALNTAGTTGFEYGVQNFFRVGAGIYGLWPSAENKAATLAQYPDFNLQSVLSWKTEVINIKTVPEGSFISYDRTYATKRETKLALLPIGYYEGYDRRLSANGPDHAPHIEIRGKFAPVLGRVCMNVTIVDITDIEGVQLRDQATIIGTHAPADVYTLAARIGSFNPREITTRIAPHIARIVVP